MSEATSGSVPGPQEQVGVAVPAQSSQQVGAAVPGQSNPGSAASGAAAPPSAAQPAAPGTAPASETADRLSQRASNVADQVSQRASDMADQVSQKASDMADQVGEKAGEVAEQVGDAVQNAAEAAGRAASQVMTRLRNNAEIAADRGATTIANEVVEKIAGIAAREVPGVYDLGGDVARIFAAVKERVGLGRDEADQGVRVRLEGRTAAVDVTIVIEFGFVIHSVTEKVREKVISSVENLLGLEVTEVNIMVDDVHVDQEGPVGNDQDRAAGYNAQTQGITVG